MSEESPSRPAKVPYGRHYPKPSQKPRLRRKRPFRACSRCFGTGQRAVIAGFGELETFQCETCSGTGKVKKE